MGSSLWLLTPCNHVHAACCGQAQLGTSSISTTLHSAAAKYVRPVSKAQQHLDHPGPGGEAPVGQQTPKLEGAAQAAGETAYTSDLVHRLASLPGVSATTPKPLYGAPVLADKIGAPLVAVDVSEAVRLTGDAGCWVGAAELVKIKAANAVGAYQV
eukprot:SAG22_NODE_371_length_11566_cov_5.447458_10_plen_156_part_00